MVFFIFCPSAIYKPFFWQPENRLITICCVSPTSSKQSLWQNLFLGSETHQTWENYLLLDFSGYTRGHKELHEDNLYTYVPNLNISGYIYIEREFQSKPITNDTKPFSKPKPTWKTPETHQEPWPQWCFTGHQFQGGWQFLPVTGHQQPTIHINTHIASILAINILLIYLSSGYLTEPWKDLPYSIGKLSINGPSIPWLC